MEGRDDKLDVFIFDELFKLYKIGSMNVRRQERIHSTCRLVDSTGSAFVPCDERAAQTSKAPQCCGAFSPCWGFLVGNTPRTEPLVIGYRATCIP